MFNPCYQCVFIIINRKNILFLSFKKKKSSFKLSINCTIHSFRVNSLYILVLQQVWGNIACESDCLCYICLHRPFWLQCIKDYYNIIIPVTLKMFELSLWVLLIGIHMNSMNSPIILQSSVLK